MNLRRVVLGCLQCLFVGAANAQWVDITDEFLQNAGFDNNSTTGWTWTSDASSQKADYDCMEFWNGTFDFKQQIDGLPVGKYRLSLQAFYRTGSREQAYSDYTGNTAEVTTVLYAGNKETKIANIFSYDFGEQVSGCWSYSPN